MPKRPWSTQATACVAACVTLLAAVPAHAQYYAPFASPVYVVTPDRSSLMVGDQYFSATVAGARELCQAKPELCASPAAADQLARLRRRQVATWVLAGTGAAAALTGAGLLIASLVRSDEVIATRGLFIGGLASLGAGGVLELASVFVAPSTDDLRHLVNTINSGAGAGEERVKWNIGLGPGGQPHLALGVRF